MTREQRIAAAKEAALANVFSNLLSVTGGSDVARRLPTTLSVTVGQAGSTRELRDDLAARASGVYSVLQRDASKGSMGSAMGLLSSMAPTSMLGDMSASHLLPPMVAIS
ncbi:hypothetical protein EON62_03325, partial [archaeon]